MGREKQETGCMKCCFFVRQTLGTLCDFSSHMSGPTGQELAIQLHREFCIKASGGPGEEGRNPRGHGDREEEF